ncbi:ferredoxin reductase [Oceaniserpentilla sp. 4NH20-0058]
MNSLTNHNTLADYLEPLINGVVPGWRADRLRSYVTHVRNENADMYSLVIKPNKKWKGFEAGQYIELTVEKNGAWMSRYFSISSSPEYFQITGLIELSIRIQEQGRITPWLPNALKANGIVNISQAMGEFTLNPEHQNICMIAGGSGITPFRSMLQQLNLQSAQSNQNITLMYYARSDQHFLFEDEFKQVSNLNPLIQLNLMNSEYDGNINQSHLDVFVKPESDTHFYICGPSPMIVLTRKLLQEANINSDHIHYEFFGPEPLSLDIQSEGAAILFERSNKQIESDADETSTLLEIAEQNNLNPVSGCRMGVCHQCICQKKSGVVYNTKTQTYSDTGAQEIQLCISVPVNDVVLDL